ncbi:MAG: hypothetical protein IPP35_11480 [Elusimicrobia bacterium]|nr:hypothetical protein [Elusimicrobiota bacterium]
MIAAGFTLAVVALFFLARGFARGLDGTDRPRFVHETPLWPKDLAPVVKSVDRWRDEGRLTGEEHEKLRWLLREDADRISPRP